MLVDSCSITTLKLLQFFLNQSTQILLNLYTLIKRSQHLNICQTKYDMSEVRHASEMGACIGRSMSRRVKEAAKNGVGMQDHREPEGGERGILSQ
jgi:hypothetical protein